MCGRENECVGERVRVCGREIASVWERECECVGERVRVCGGVSVWESECGRESV